MHISEGIINTPTIAISTAITTIAIVYTIKHLKSEDITKVSMLSGLFFVASFIHIPLGVTSIHLILHSILGVVLGINAILAIFVALLFQALFFGYGGLSTIGINTIVMGLPAIIAYYIYIKDLKYKEFLVGFVAVLLSSILLNGVLVLNGEEFITSAKIIFVSNIPLMFLEGFITLLIFRFLSKAKVKI